jgi:hypothetical protein
MVAGTRHGTEALNECPGRMPNESWGGSLPVFLNLNLNRNLTLTLTQQRGLGFR